MARSGKNPGYHAHHKLKFRTDHEYPIQPHRKKQGITKVGRHTFRRTYTTLLHANDEDVKVVQDLLRHGSARITMDVYAQAVTPAKRMAPGKVVAMLRDTKKDEQTE